MAIIECPGCNKRVSNMTTTCPLCGSELKGIDEERLQELRRRKLKDKVYYTKMYSYLALTLLIVAFGWYLKATAWFQHQSSMGPYILFAIGAVAYLVVRGLMLKYKIELRKLY